MRPGPDHPLLSNPTRFSSENDRPIAAGAVIPGRPARGLGGLFELGRFFDDVTWWERVVLVLMLTSVLTASPVDAASIATSGPSAYLPSAFMRSLLRVHLHRRAIACRAFETRSHVPPMVPLQNRPDIPMGPSVRPPCCFGVLRLQRGGTSCRRLTLTVVSSGHHHAAGPSLCDALSTCRHAHDILSAGIALVEASAGRSRIWTRRPGAGQLRRYLTTLAAGCCRVPGSSSRALAFMVALITLPSADRRSASTSPSRS